MHDNEVNDEKRDRAVRWVLWASLGIAVAPMLAALAFVQPTLSRLQLTDASGQLQSELPLGGSDAIGSFLSRGASGIVRAVQGTLAPSDITLAPDLRPLNEGRAHRRFTSTIGGHDPVLDCASDEAACEGSAAIGGLHADAETPLITLGPSPAAAGRGALLVGLALRRSSSAGQDRDVAWRMLDDGVFVRDVGGASFTLAGAVALDEFVALRPISDTGLGGYLSDAPELHYGALSGGLARTFEQGGWRLRPELDLEASYLALEKVRLDAGEAGLFVPEAEDWIFSARPSVALEGDLAAAPGFRLTPSLRAGATWLSQTEFSSAAMMLDAPATVAGVSASLPVEELFADVEAGLGLKASDRVQLSVRYGRVFGETLEAQTGRLELNMQF